LESWLQSAGHAPPKFQTAETRAGKDKETDAARVGNRFKAEFLRPVETVAMVIDIQNRRLCGRGSGCLSGTLW
jgi:hypothetical protein